MRWNSESNLEDVQRRPKTIHWTPNSRFCKMECDANFLNEINVVMIQMEWSHSYKSYGV